MKIVGRRQSHLFQAWMRTFLAIIISLVILAVQLAGYYFIFFTAYRLWYIRIITEVLGFFVVLGLYSRDVNFSYKLSWTIFILALPFAGTVFWFIFGGGRRIPKRKARKINAELEKKAVENDCRERIAATDPRGAKLVEQLARDSHYPLYDSGTTHFFPCAAEKHESLLADLEKAKEFILLEYFIISDGYVLESLIDVLTRKGREGVKIKFIYDDIGSKKCLRRKTKKRIADIENLELCVFEPVGLVINPRINYRDHRKIAVIDGKVAYLGGDNLADEYVGKKIKFGEWRDNAMRFTGDAVYSVCLMFAEMWYMASGEVMPLPDFEYFAREKTAEKVEEKTAKNNDSDELPVGENVEENKVAEIIFEEQGSEVSSAVKDSENILQVQKSEVHSPVTENESILKENGSEISSPATAENGSGGSLPEAAETKEGGMVMPFGDGPINPLDPAYHLFESLMASAQKELFISTPYFIIDNAFIDMIQLAARSGVDVRILVPHIPDKKVIFAMTRGHYGDVLRAGGKIYEYTPGFNHAKNVIVDGKYAFIGTVNCDYRSMLLHFECGALLLDTPSIADMRSDFLDACSRSEEITLEKWKHRSIFTKITQYVLSFIAPLL